MMKVALSYHMYYTVLTLIIITAQDTLQARRMITIAQDVLLACHMAVHESLHYLYHHQITIK